MGNSLTPTTLQDRSPSLQRIHYEVSTQIFERDGTKTLDKFQKKSDKPVMYKDVKNSIRRLVQN